jgi:hypothetical protein
MADREAIKRAILDAAGNPSAGVIAEYADRFADAVVALDAPKRAVDTREKRVVEATERR